VAHAISPGVSPWGCRRQIGRMRVVLPEMSSPSCEGECSCLRFPVALAAVANCRVLPEREKCYSAQKPVAAVGLAGTAWVNVADAELAAIAAALMPAAPAALPRCTVTVLVV